MLKKVTACLLALLSLNFLIFAQIVDESDVVSSGESVAFEEILPSNYQVQHIQWKEVKRALGYEIELQSLQSNGKWTDSGTWETEAPEFDFKLAPGSYRFRISVFNTLGKKAGTSDWAEFDIFDSTQPVLHRNSFPENTRFGLPEITRSISDENGTEIISVRGLHCFEAGTVFKLIPEDNRSGTIILPVTGSNPDRHLIQLSLDWSKLDFGEYNLVVENSMRESDSIKVLVQPKRIPALAVSNMYYDSVLKADCLNPSRNGEISIEVQNAQSDTVIALKPITNTDNTYPFETGFTRYAVNYDGTISSGKITLNPGYSLKPGWYELTAETPDAGRDVVQFLVQEDDAQSILPRITEISGKINIDTQMIVITVKTDQGLFSDEQPELVKLFCISERNEYGENKRFQLRQTSAAKNGRSAVFEMPASSLEPAVYAVMIETADSARLAFIEADSKYKVSMTELTDEQIKQQFLLAPTEEVLAARAAERERLELAGLKYPEFIPAFRNSDWGSWSFISSGNFPSEVTADDDSIRFSVQNNVGERKYTSTYRLSDNESLEMLKTSEGMTFESIVTRQNNSRTKWSLAVQTEGSVVTIPIDSKLNKLTQTVVKWDDYKIDPLSITGISIKSDIKDPHDPGYVNAFEMYDVKTYSSLEPVKELVIKHPFLFTKVSAYAGVFLSDNSDLTRANPGLEDLYDDRLGPAGFPSSVHLSVYDCDWFSLNAVYQPKGMGGSIMAGGEAVVSIPSDLFRPYLGVGMSFWGEDTWNELFGGLVLFKYLDVRYSLFHKYNLIPPSATFSTANPKGEAKSWYADWIQVGLQLPLRKNKINYVDPTVAAKKHVLFTDFTIGLELSERTYTEISEYYSYVPDISFGIRAFDLKFFAIDTTVAARGIPAENPVDLESLDGRADAVIHIPFKILKTEFGIEYAVGAGYWLGLQQQQNHVYLSQTLGFQFGKYVKAKASFLLFDDNWQNVLDLVNNDPLLTPFMGVIMSNYWTVGLSVSVPLRTKL